MHRMGVHMVNKIHNFFAVELWLWSVFHLKHENPVHVLEKETVYMKIMEIKIMKNNMEIKLRKHM